MLFPEYIYLSCIVILSVLFFACVFKLYRFSLILLDLEDTIEESFDILDYHHQKMIEILEKPVFFDSVEIRQVVSDIRSCQNAVLVILESLIKRKKEICAHLSALLNLDFYIIEKIE